MNVDKLKQWAKLVKRDVVAVYYAARDKRTPTPARVVAVAIAAYALSPIDLIPDIIPIIGYLDDLVIVPLGLLLVVRMIPAIVLQDSRDKATAMLARPKSYVAAAMVLGIWLLGIVLLVYLW
ncbi:MAG: DUF1232 domain-containing protein [Granulosicoccaceae bacterium]